MTKREVAKRTPRQPAGLPDLHLWYEGRASQLELERCLENTIDWFRFLSGQLSDEEQAAYAQLADEGHRKVFRKLWDSRHVKELDLLARMLGARRLTPRDIDVRELPLSILADDPLSVASYLPRRADVNAMVEYLTVGRDDPDKAALLEAAALVWCGAARIDGSEEEFREVVIDRSVSFEHVRRLIRLCDFNAYMCHQGKKWNQGFVMDRWQKTTRAGQYEKCDRGWLIRPATLRRQRARRKAG